MLKLQNNSVIAEEFALEYIKYDALIKHSYRKNKSQYRRVLAYQSLGQRFGVNALQAHKLEQMFRRHVLRKMRWLVAVGLRHTDELPMELGWLVSVEDCLRLLPDLLQGAAGEAEGAAGAVARALCVQARVRGALSHPAMFAAARRALALPASELRLEAAWEKAKRLCLEYLSAATREGDLRGAVGEFWRGWVIRVADTVLLYTDVDKYRVLAEERQQLDAEAGMLAVLWQLVQKYRLEERAPPRCAVRAQRWTRALRDYVAGGRSASVVVLQRRWHELARRARYKLLNYWRTTTAAAATASRDQPLRFDRPACLDPPGELHIAILQRFPHIVLTQLPTWRELVEKDLIVTKPLDDFTEERRVEVTADRTACITITPRRRASGPHTDAEFPQPLSKQIKSEPDDVVEVAYECSSNVPCVQRVKTESGVMDTEYNIVVTNIKTEVDDDIKNDPYHDIYKAECTMKREIKHEPTANDTEGYQVEVNISVKEEPQAKGSKCPIVFSDDDVTEDDDSDDGEDSFDIKLLLEPRVELTRLEDGALNPQEMYEIPLLTVKVESEPAEGTDYAESNQTTAKREMDNQHSTKHAEAQGAPAEVDARSYKRFLTRNKRHNLHKVPRPSLRNERIAFAKEDPNTMSAQQLQLLLQELTDIALMNQVLKHTKATCCAARKHFDINDARVRVGLPPLPQHTHEGGAACACCCGARGRRGALEDELRALRRELALLAEPKSEDLHY